MFRKELLIRFPLCVFRERLSICVCVSIHFGFQDGMI